VDHKSVSAQRSKATITPTDEKSTPFSIHNYNQHVTPSPYLPYPKQNQTKSDKSGSSKTDRKEPDAGVAKETPEGSNIDENTTTGPELSAEKQPTPKPKVYTTVLHPTPRSVQAEMTFLATTPHPTANKKQPPSQSVSKTPSLATSGGPPAKRQKMLVEPQELPELEATFTRALAPPVFLDPVDSFESAERLLHFLESPLHRARLPSPKGRKRTVAELAADEALAAEEERFMLIMDERLEPAASAAAGGSKSAVDDAAGAVPFEPRFSRFKTIENIRIQHEDKAKQEHERKVQQEHAKRQQQEQERERRRLLEQRQAEEHAKEEARRQIAVQQAQLAAQQSRMAQANGISQASQGQMSSPVVRNQTPHNTSSPIVATNMSSQAAVSMAMSGSAQGAGSPPRPPSALQHSHPGMMGHPMAPSRSQQSHSRHGTPQMTQGTPAMSHSTPVMRNVTPTQRMAHGSPPNSSMAQTPVMNHAMMGTPQMGAGMGLTPQQQQMILQQRQQQLLAQQGHQFSPQQIAAMQANAHAQQNIQSHQQQMLQHQAQQNQHPQQQQHNLQHMQNQQAYQSQLMRTQLVQMQMAQQKQQQGNAPQITPQQQHQQQMLMAAAQANGGQLPQNAQSYSVAQQYQQLFQQRLHHLRKEMAERYLAQYGPPPNYPPQIAQQYGPGLEKSAKAYVQELMRRSRENAQQRQVVAAMQQQQQQRQQQQQQQNMMANGMGK
jgi:transcription factor SPT20